MSSILDLAPDVLWATMYIAAVPVALVALSAYGVHRMEKSSPTGRSRGLSTAAVFGVGLLGGAAVWFAWLSWGDYYTGADGLAHGPYRPWQVLACGATAVVVSGAVGWFARWRMSGPLVGAIGFLLGFATCWAFDAADDTTGLWGVGYLFLIVGGGLGLLTVAVAVIGARARLAGRHG
ncbi:MAG: hypothetical protein QM728_06850 [Gordonia sp. (in: high G+C Gram-positive bacteria)]|uniref:hypothetical protein n=1 Tax=Gordonia sp. (in: high G+C Gram-positive bacteria) TaxID=84139 RepID=UPI0039E7014E